MIETKWKKRQKTNLTIRKKIKHVQQNADIMAAAWVFRNDIAILALQLNRLSRIWRKCNFFTWFHISDEALKIISWH